MYKLIVRNIYEYVYEYEDLTECLNNVKKIYIDHHMSYWMDEKLCTEEYIMCVRTHTKLLDNLKDIDDVDELKRRVLEELNGYYENKFKKMVERTYDGCILSLSIGKVQYKIVNISSQ